MYEGKEEIHKYMQYEVSDCLYGQDSKSKKSTKMTAIYKLHVRITKYLMCMYGGYRYICVPNMKFVCLTLWLGEVCTEATTEDANADNTNTDDAQQSKHDCIRLFG